MKPTVWTVDSHMNIVRERDAERAKKECVGTFGSVRFHIFETKLEAFDYMVSRAKKELVECEDAVKCARRNVGRLLKRRSIEVSA